MNPSLQASPHPLDTVACGQCSGCIVERARAWAVRGMHEDQCHDKSCYITLTYNWKHLPGDMSLDLRHWQLFAKKLRNQVGPFRYLMCGEYGEKRHRPHYHAIIWGLDFKADQVLLEAGPPALYTSPTLEKLWGKGFVTIGEVTFDSIAYVARYVTKKVRGGGADDQHYQGRKPEFITMSRRPGLGKPWFDKFKSDVYPHDHVIMRGQEMNVPAYYDRLMAKENPALVESLKERRKERAKAKEADNTPERLAVKERVMKRRFAAYKREPGRKK